MNGTTNILVSGANGRLGTAIRQAAKENANATITAGVDINPQAGETPIYANFDEIPEDAKIDVIIDCSHHSAVRPLLAFAKKRNLPVVICTTGHTDDEADLIKETAKTLPVFWSRNMSLGINLLISLAKRAAEVLGDGYDIEIIEKHHNKKLDAPSGTALMIADAVKDIVTETRGKEAEYTFERASKREQRKPQEIGISSIRGGTIVGEHEIMFAGKDEILSISHSAASREVFAVGAIRAALFMKDRPDGFYDMGSMIG